LPSTLNPGFLADPYPSPVDIPGVGSLSKAAEDPCTLLGRALRDTTISAYPQCDFNITDKILDDLMANFPQGQIFDLSETKNEEWSIQPPDPVRDLCRQLACHFPDASSVLFSPIWDWNKSRWLAGTLVWTSNNFRALGADELHYFKVFGDSIISEVARVDWATTQKSKSAFMSSVSHELRSPLHGILASAELLGATSLPPQEQHLVNMVEACGMTLLDTLNHL
jgi:signal transduction histidine kinase